MILQLNNLYLTSEEFTSCDMVNNIFINYGQYGITDFKQNPMLPRRLGVEEIPAQQLPDG